MSLLRAWLVARRFPVVLGVGGGFALAGLLAPGAALPLPLLPRPLPLTLALVLVPPVLVTTPLVPPLAALERTLPRARLDRGSAALLACAAGAAVCVPSSLRLGAAFPWPVLLALMSLAVAAVVVLGDAAWLPTTTASVAAVYLDVAHGEVLRAPLDAVGVPALAAVLAVACAWYALRGPAYR